MNTQQVNINNVYEKLYQVPLEKLVEVDHFINILLKSHHKKGEPDNTKTILSFAGMWKEMNKKEFFDLEKEFRMRRKRAFLLRRLHESCND